MNGKAGDLRCPIGQAEELFAALKRLKKEVVFVRYPQETSHGLSRSGPPDLRIDRLNRICEWLDKWCRSS
ncbi:alpha/beta hydrolase family protein [Fervidibacter sacchari]|jgi:Dipeptidyl aminopeptidases/acylaminoacyl-peptidases